MALQVAHLKKGNKNPCNALAGKGKIQQMICQNCSPFPCQDTEKHLAASPEVEPSGSKAGYFSLDWKYHMLPWYPVPQQLDVRPIHFGVSTYSRATWKKYKLQSQLPKCLRYQSRVTTTAIKVKTVQHHWIPKKVMILNWWDLQQLSTTRHFFQAQTVICFPGPRFHGGKPSIHRIPGFQDSLWICVFLFRISCRNALFWPMAIQRKQFVHQMVASCFCSGENLPWNSMSFSWFHQSRLQPFFEGRSSFQPEVWIPSEESMCKCNQLVLSVEILIYKFFQELHWQNLTSSLQTGLKQKYGRSPSKTHYIPDCQGCKLNPSVPSVAYVWCRNSAA